MKLGKLKIALASMAVGATLLSAGVAQGARPYSYVEVYYPDASMTGQAVGFKSVSCSSNVRLDGVKTPYAREENRHSCSGFDDGYFIWDYLTGTAVWMPRD